MRRAGILMPVASLPSKYGNGDFGSSARTFIDLASEAGFSLWQVLPLNPLGYGNSPYQPYSSYALDDIYLSIENLLEQGLIDEIPKSEEPGIRIDYTASRRERQKIYRKAYKRFKPDMNFLVFSYQEWVRNYAVFMTFKKKNRMKCWLEWPSALKDEPQSHEVDLKPYEDEILYQAFLQYELYLQWQDLRNYAHSKGITIMGDMPFYVGLDSADVWSHRDGFLLDKDGHPRFVAGVPPDYFSADGQRWGNPIYDWKHLKETDFDFWIERLGYAGRMFDIIRLDHFRAFDTYWQIPADCDTARVGEWIEAPGYELFDDLLKKVPDIRIIAEDLGDLRAEVLELRDHYDFEGMRVIQFSFDPAGMGDDKSHLLVYTGTHDNGTILQWYQEKSLSEKRKITSWFRQHGYMHRSFCDNMIDYAMDSKSDMVILPMADLLKMGCEGRINTPGTVGSPNWEWCLKDFRSFKGRVKRLYEILSESKRTVKHRR